MRPRKTIAISFFTLFFFVLSSTHGADDKLDLKLRLKPGEKHNMRITTSQTISQTMMGKTQEIIHTKNLRIEVEAKKLEVNDLTPIEITFRTQKETTTIEGITRGYDSTKPISPEDNITQMYSAMMGESFIAKLTPRGEIAVLELDKMYLSMAQKMMESEDTMLKNRLKEKAQRAIERTNKRYGTREKRMQALKQQIEQFPFFNKKQIKSIVNKITVVFPISAVRIGDSWKEKIETESAEIYCTHTLQGNENGTVSIKVSGTRSINEEPVISEIGPVKSSTKLAGSYNATIQVDVKSGRLLSKRADMSFSGETTISGNNQTPKEQTIPMSIKATVTIEPVQHVEI
jgi:citrate lyase gamma subunit